MRMFRPLYLLYDKGNQINGGAQKDGRKSVPSQKHVVIHAERAVGIRNRSRRKLRLILMHRKQHAYHTVHYENTDIVQQCFYGKLALIHAGHRQNNRAEHTKQSYAL